MIGLLGRLLKRFRFFLFKRKVNKGIKRTAKCGFAIGNAWKSILEGMR